MSTYWQRTVWTRRTKVCLLIAVFGAIVLLSYQVYFLKVLSDEASKVVISKLKKVSAQNEQVRGANFADSEKYKPNSRGNFVCFVTKEEINFKRVNDDYCDCVEDGCDEPGTSACQNGVFYCETQVGLAETPGFFPSSRVNDGICDCCDGSDEWAQIFLPGRLNEQAQKKLGRYQSPCPNLCPEDE